MWILLRVGLLCALLGVACSSTNKSRPASTGGTNGPDLADSAAPAEGGGPGGNARACPEVNEPDNAGVLGPKSLNEASGMTATQQHASVLWLHNDSGSEPRLFATRDDGVALGIVEITGAEAMDWEDIAVGPGPVANKSYLYVADIGDNEKKRDGVQIYRLEEPKLDADGKPTVSSAKADRISVKYEKGARDAETLLVDPLSGDLYIVEKKMSKSGVYRIPSPGAGSSSVTAKEVAQVNLVLSTGGAVLPAGDGFAIRTYFGVSYWPRDPKLPLDAAFGNEPCALKLAAEQQGESLSFFADGNGYYTASEGADAILHAYRFK